jgi:hypothetical protein
VIANDWEVARSVRKKAAHTAAKSLDCRTITLSHVTELKPQQASLIALLWQKSPVAAWRAPPETFDFAFRTA